MYFTDLKQYQKAFRIFHYLKSYRISLQYRAALPGEKVKCNKNAL